MSASVAAAQIFASAFEEKLFDWRIPFTNIWVRQTIEPSRFLYLWKEAISVSPLRERDAYAGDNTLMHCVGRAKKLPSPSCNPFNYCISC
jgi:hypothetical protein